MLPVRPVPVPNRPASPAAAHERIRRCFGGSTRPYALAITATKVRTTARLCALLNCTIACRGFSAVVEIAAAPGAGATAYLVLADDYFEVSEAVSAFNLLRRFALCHPELFPA